MPRWSGATTRARRRSSTCACGSRATFQEALLALEGSVAEALRVVRPIAPAVDRNLGVVTRADVGSTHRASGRDHCCEPARRRPFD
jgi:hypothetical protein